MSNTVRQTGRKPPVNKPVAMLRISYQDLHQATVVDRPLPVTAARVELQSIEKQTGEAGN